MSHPYSLPYSLVLSHIFMQKSRVRQTSSVTPLPRSVPMGTDGARRRNKAWVEWAHGQHKRNSRQRLYVRFSFNKQTHSTQCNVNTHITHVNNIMHPSRSGCTSPRLYPLSGVQDSNPFLPQELMSSEYPLSDVRDGNLSSSACSPPPALASPARHIDKLCH